VDLFVQPEAQACFVDSLAPVKQSAARVGGTLHEKLGALELLASPTLERREQQNEAALPGAVRENEDALEPEAYSGSSGEDEDNSGAFRAVPTEV
jgi:hypothetical protein